MAPISPQDVVIRGRLSWPNFTYAEALAFNKKSDYPKPDDRVRPSFQLLLDEVYQEKLVTHLQEHFLPWCMEQEKAGNKPGDKSALSAAHVKKLSKILDEADWETDGVLGLIKPVHEKTVDLAPEAVCTLAVNGFAKRDLDLKAVVRSIDELANPTDDLVIPERGMILPVADTTHELYPGSYVSAQINLYAFLSAGNPGITCSTSAAIFVGHAERFGGGAALDEDAVFMDLD